MVPVKLIVSGITLVVSTVAGIRKIRKEERTRWAKIEKIIREVDQREAEEKQAEEEVEKIVDDVDWALSGMDIDGDEGMTLDQKVDEIIQKGNQVLRKANSMLGDSEENRQKANEVLETIEKIKAGEDQKELWDKQQREKAEKKWQDACERAIKQKDFHKLENLFDQKYAGGPWHPSPASVFGDAHRDGVIDDELYKEAQEHFGRLWNYSGD